MFKRAVFGVWSPSRLVAIAALAGVALIGREWPALLVAGVALIVIVSVSWSDVRALHRAAAPVAAG